MRQLKISKQLTNRESLSINKFLHEVAKIELISPEEEVELAMRIQEGDEVALERLVNANLRFVVSVAKQYQVSGMALEDLISEGNLGLIKAAQKFDPTKGFKFISYAVWWIRQSIMASLGENSRLVRIPANKIAQIKKVNQFRMEMSHQLEREPTKAELAENYDLEESVIKETENISRAPVSMDAPITDDEKSSLVNILEDSNGIRPDSGLLKESLVSDVERLVGELAHKEQKIIIEFFGLFGVPSRSYNEIADSLNISKERVRQIKLKALKKLQRKGRNTHLNLHLA